MLVGAAIAGAWDSTIGDLIILMIGITWLWFKPGIWPVALLCIYQLASLSANSYMLMQQSVGSLPHKALTVHVVIRVATLFYLWQGVRQSGGVKVDQA